MEELSGSVEGCFHMLKCVCVCNSVHVKGSAVTWDSKGIKYTPTYLQTPFFPAVELPGVD